MAEDKPAVILGQQMAAARKAEAQRLAAGNVAPSPLDPSAHYAPEELDFARLVESPRDSIILDMVRRYAAANSEDQTTIRAALSLNDFYALIGFANRQAAFALRDNDPAKLRDGANAVALVEQALVDWRDLGMATGLLHASAHKIKCGTAFLTDAARIAEPAVAELLTSAAARGAVAFEAWGYVVREFSAGSRLVRSDRKSFHPTMALEQVAYELADLLRADVHDAEVTLASNMPPVWLGKVDNDALSEAMKSIVAGATVNRRLRAGHTDRPQFQQFTMFLVELNANDAATLARLTQAKLASGHALAAMLGINAGRLFCLAIARCAMQGGAAFETQERLRRFVAPIHHALLRAGT